MTKAITEDGMDVYYLGTMEFEGLKTNPRYDNDGGIIIIGGDKGDVWANCAGSDESGVELVGVQFRTYLDFDLTEDEVTEFARDVVEFSYESIQEDTFIPQRER